MSQITKRALEQSLKNLLLQKPITKITINDIAEDCGINRMTFYYHFKDIYDLVEWSCEEDARKAIEGNKTYGTWEQGFLNVFRHVSREKIEQYLYRVVYDLLMNVIEECSLGMAVREEDKVFIADFYKYGFVGLMLEWIHQNMEPDPEEIVSRLSNLIEGDVKRALEKHCLNASPSTKPI